MTGEAARDLVRLFDTTLEKMCLPALNMSHAVSRDGWSVHVQLKKYRYPRYLPPGSRFVTVPVLEYTVEHDWDLEMLADYRGPIGEHITNELIRFIEDSVSDLLRHRLGLDPRPS